MDMQERAELALFNEAVGAWAERFTPDRVRRFATIMGRRADRVTHTHYCSYTEIAKSYRKHYKRAIGYTTVWRYLRLFEERGIITVERRHWGKNDTHPGAQRNNLYTVQFGGVLLGDTLVEHDFYQGVTIGNETPHETLRETRSETRRETPYN